METLSGINIQTDGTGEFDYSFAETLTGHSVITAFSQLICNFHICQGQKKRAETTDWSAE